MDRTPLTLDTISFSWPEAAVPVFAGLSLTFSRGWTAITGPNGGGKTTLLKLICGILAPEGGVIRPRAEAVYCPQESVILPEAWENAFASLDGWAGKILALLGIEDDWLFRWETLSGGEQKRLQLAAALCMRPPLLALDEPTNHLDAQSRECIIRALAEYEGTGLLVSHDRELMDRLCGATLFLAPGEARIYPGGALKALALREKERASRLAEWQSAEDRLRKTQKFSQAQAEEVSRSKARLSMKGVSRRDHSQKAKIQLARLTGKDATASAKKKKANTLLDAARKKLEDLEKPLLRKEGVTLLSAKSQADTVLSLAAGEIRAGDYRLVFPEIVITPSSRIGLTGNNGAGKTLLVKKILTEIKKEDYFYLPQEPGAGELEKFLARFEARAAAQKAALLSSFYRLGGNPQNFGDYAAQAASPGELRKLLIAEALTRPLFLIVMDEPTNYMDITSVEILEEALAASACALLLVSHDTVFLGRLTTENWTVQRSCSEGRLLLS